ncbi:phosphoadenylyl-sulfate reductase [Rhodoblastus acidophilus]|uniref:Adenosine 5'-phosphosulfate reductase n=1 Tax=Rhodoblastus acidophilus TaxID=1074 RepID=A0A6N8DSL5_RHOAC|nr:phosphoadenylyl-sulfate reductase [Rhodoblastus acidophilus]MCW2275217.1 phosphoadenosine phosphosulfate reductase [Rhodoblastus acidophilus]MTV32183.1 phosphoadenylyl-sulfate reductase [Rhodoblastus acidophilus]
MSESSLSLVDTLNAAFASATLPNRLRALRKAVDGRIVFTTSFGIEDQAITHALAESEVDFEVVTLDTGRLFPETYELWQRTEEQYALRIKAFYPDAHAVEALIADQGINGFYYGLDMRKACCEVRKVEPLARALSGAQVWVTGLRGDQNAHRSNLGFVEWDAERGLLKANPLFDFSRDDVVAYTKANHAPVNALHEKGFVSIGCAPCTRAIKPGEPERAGRWWWESEDKKECGLHVSTEGRVSRVKEAAE